MLQHVGSEFGYLLEGELEITVGFEVFTLHAGEALGFDSATPHLLTNNTDHVARGIWCVRHGYRITRWAHLTPRLFVPMKRILAIAPDMRWTPMRLTRRGDVMKALQFVGDNKCVVNELPVPEIGDDEVLLASRSVGICHSDIELLAGRYIIPFEFPVIPGHEWSAEVVRVGRAVKGLGPGDRVVGECVIGQEHFGFSISGAAAEFFVAKQSWLHRLPDNLSWTQGALVEPFSCGYYATVRADNLDASDTVLVLGAGPIGSGCRRGRGRQGGAGSRGRAVGRSGDLGPAARGRRGGRPDRGVVRRRRSLR